MGRKLTDAEKAENANRRAAKKAEADAKKAEAKANAEAEAIGGENPAGGAGEAAPESGPEPAALLKGGKKAKGDRMSVQTKRGVKSRWRAGYNFGPKPREIPLDDLDDDQLEALQADPSLVVSLEG